jgi:DOPA 4,5-dioxygenase
MPLLIRDPADIAEYHAHVYYRPDTQDHAVWVREELGARFPVHLGRWRDQPVGPHTRSMYQVLFPSSVFACIVPWLMLNRGPLDVLVHPETGDEFADHTAHALWLGERLPLRLEALAQPPTR